VIIKGWVRKNMIYKRVLVVEILAFICLGCSETSQVADGAEDSEFADGEESNDLEEWSAAEDGDSVNGEETLLPQDCGTGMNLGDANPEIWPGCTETGNYCLPDDEMVYTTDCLYSDGSRGYSPACDGGTCECGYIRWINMCDTFTCTDNPYWPSERNQWYCDTGKRILCANGCCDFAITRIGCCDENNNVFCLRCPIEGTNRCEP
jgi:hypothetical protein